jgi:hypothetical protein
VSSSDARKGLDLRLSAEAQRYLAEVEQRRLAVMANVSRLPVAALIWGPTPSGDSPVAQTRRLLRDESLLRNVRPMDGSNRGQRMLLLESGVRPGSLRTATGHSVNSCASGLAP